MKKHDGIAVKNKKGKHTSPLYRYKDPFVLSPRGRKEKRERNTFHLSPVHSTVKNTKKKKYIVVPDDITFITYPLFFSIE